MPEYDATNYPRPMADDLTDAETGRDSAAEDLTTWPSSNLIPDSVDSSNQIYPRTIALIIRIHCQNCVHQFWRNISSHL